MDEHEYRAFDGLGLAQLVANKETTAAELLAIAQARADRVNPRINAITNRLDGRAARQLRENLTGPYAEVPFCWQTWDRIWLEPRPRPAAVRWSAAPPHTRAPLCSSGCRQAWLFLVKQIPLSSALSGHRT
jgi:hypothetical protein